MKESVTKWLKRIGSKKAMEHRRTERLAGRMNAQVKGPRSLRTLVGRMTGTIRPHSLTCKCEDCQPPSPELPITKIITPEPKKGFKQPKKKWDSQRGRSSN